MTEPAKENGYHLLRRLFIYQKERFPVLGHGLMIAVFTFSVVSYSRMCRAVEGFIDWSTYGWGAFMTFSLFLLLRISDEFKDKVDDALYRKYLPVPRGLVSLKELLWIALIAIFSQVLVLIFIFPELIYLYLIVMVYLGLMRIEFGIPQWLKDRPVFYMVSHMFIMPFVDLFASGLDWKLEGMEAPVGLFFFFGVSYLNGVVMEIGRKIKIPETEEHGVVSYSKLWGSRNAALIWALMLLANASMAVIAGWYAGYGQVLFLTMGGLFLVFVSPGIYFMLNQGKKTAKMIELFSVLWTVLMYLVLGAAPMLHQLFF